jgi:hypothetical protein
VHIPSPADAKWTAEEFLTEVRRRGGRIYRMPHLRVFALADGSLAAWLIEQGAGEFGSYERARGVREHDIYLHRVPVSGEESIHQAAARFMHNANGASE